MFAARSNQSESTVPVWAGPEVIFSWKRESSEAPLSWKSTLNCAPGTARQASSPGWLSTMFGARASFLI